MTSKFPNQIDVFTPDLVNDFTVVNATHIKDLRSAILALENSIAGVLPTDGYVLPYDNFNYITSTDNVALALSKLDSVVKLLTDQVGVNSAQGDYDTNGSRIDSLFEQLDAHRAASLATDRDGYGVHGVVGTVVGTFNEQQLANKTYDSGTAFTGPKFIARGRSGDEGLRQIEVYDTTGLLVSWIDEQGNAKFNNIEILGDEILVGTERVQNNLVVDGYTQLGNDPSSDYVLIQGPLTVTGSVSASGNLNITGSSASLGSSSGDGYFNYQGSYFSGNVRVGGTLTVSGLSNLGNGTEDDLIITGNTQVNGNLTTFGDFTTTGDVRLGQGYSKFIQIQASHLDAYVGTYGTGNVNFYSNLYNTGNIQFGAGSTSSDFVFGLPNGIGTFTVYAETELHNSLVVDDNITTGGALTVTSSATIGSALTVGTTLAPTTTTAYGTLSVSSSATFGASGHFVSDLSTGGDLSVAGMAEIDGNTTISGTLSLNGGYQGNIYNPATTNHGGATFDTNGNFYLDGKLTVKGPIDPASLTIDMVDSLDTSVLKPLVIRDYQATSIFEIDRFGDAYIAGSTTIQNNLITQGSLIELGSGSGNLTIDVDQISISGNVEFENNVRLGTIASIITIPGSLQLSAINNVASINNIDFTQFNTQFNRHILDKDLDTGSAPVMPAKASHQAQFIGFTSAQFGGSTTTNVYDAITRLVGSGWTLSSNSTLKYALDQLVSDSGYLANRALSNLSSTTAVNTNLLPNTTGTVNLGSLSYSWKDVFATGTIRGSGFDVPTPQVLAIGASVGPNPVYLGGSTSTVVVQNNLTVSNTATMLQALTSKLDSGYLDVTANPIADTFTPTATTNPATNATLTFTSTGTLPAGIAAGTIYYVVNPSPNPFPTFQVSLTQGGLPVNFSTTGTGTLTAKYLLDIGTQKADIINMGQSGTRIKNPGILETAARVVKVGTVQTANYTIQLTDYIVRFDTTSAVSSVIATLPAASGCTGMVVIIKDAGGACATANKHILITPSGSDTIDGTTQLVLNFAPYSSVTLVSSGSSSWMII